MPAGEYYGGRGIIHKRGLIYKWWQGGASNTFDPPMSNPIGIIPPPHTSFDWLRQRETPDTSYIEGSIDGVNWVVVYSRAKDKPESDPYTCTTSSISKSTITITEPISLVSQNPTPPVHAGEDNFLGNKRHYNFDE